jgi:hypothetical protein
VAGLAALTALAKRTARPEAVALLVSGAIAVAMTARVGSAANYYVEGTAFACLVAGGALAAHAGAARRLAVAALVLVLSTYAVRAARILPALPDALGIYADRHRLAGDAERGILETAARVERLAAGRPVLCQDTSLALHLSRDAVLADWFGLSGLVQRGLLPASERIEARIRDREYGAIVLNRTPGTDGFVYQGMPFIPPPWSAALFDGDRPGWRRIEADPRLLEIGHLLHRTGPRPYRFWGCPTPHLDVYVPEAGR